MQIGIPADHACTPEDCDRVCWWEPEGWTQDVHWFVVDCGEMDGEGPCRCDHHG